MVDNKAFHKLMVLYYRERFSYYVNLQYSMAGSDEDPYDRLDIREWVLPIIKTILRNGIAIAQVNNPL